MGISIREQILRRTTPVVINSFNQFFYLRNIVSKFISEGFTNILIFDNTSTYPPLLDYFNHIKNDVRVLPIYYDKNNGPHHFFLKKIYSGIFSGNAFLYTDPDISWERLADDYVSRLLDLTHKYKTFKAGSALTIPTLENLKKNLPTVTKENNKLTVTEFESQYWIQELEPGVFNSPIDTTLHLFNPIYYKDTSIITGLRVAGSGYEVKHLPWFDDDPCPIEEIDFYKNTDKGWRNWI